MQALSVAVRLGLCQTLHTATVCPKLYQQLGFRLGLVDVGGSVPIDSIGLGALGLTLLINVYEVKGEVQGIRWPEQMHEALGVMVWEEGEFAPLLVIHLVKQSWVWSRGW